MPITPDQAEAQHATNDDIRTVEMICRHIDAQLALHPEGFTWGSRYLGVEISDSTLNHIAAVYQYVGWNVIVQGQQIAFGRNRSARTSPQQQELQRKFAGLYRCSSECQDGDHNDIYNPRGYLNLL